MTDCYVESHHHKARGAESQHRDVPRPLQLHEDEHLPGQPGPLVLAQAQIHSSTQKESLGYRRENILDCERTGLECLNVLSCNHSSARINQQPAASWNRS